VDVVFATHNVGALPVLLERARHNAAAQPVEAAGPAGVGLRRVGSISVGCNNTCTFCIARYLLDQAQ
jgi:tRNA-2-methylthio-N6-dimethylallyladenosine synthase